MSKFSRIASRLFNAPLMIRPEKAEMLCAALVDRLGIAKLDRIDGTSLEASQLRQLAMDDDYMFAKPKTARDMYTVQRGVATIGLDGTTVHKLGGVEPYSGMIGYDCLKRIASDAIANDEVGAILIDGDSPGGETAGCFEFCRWLRSQSVRGGGSKPIVSFANEMSCSAAYAIASSTDAIMTTDTGIIGSIGVYTLLVDMTRGLSDKGIEVRMIRAGERKARGASFESADGETVSKLEEWVNETWVIFAQLVAENRPLSVDTVMALNGDWFTGPDALELGLVDAVDSPENIFSAVAEMVK